MGKRVLPDGGAEKQMRSAWFYAWVGDNFFESRSRAQTIDGRGPQGRVLDFYDPWIDFYDPWIKGIDFYDPWIKWINFYDPWINC